MTGLLKGYDQLLNLVLDEVEEQLQGTCVHHESFGVDSHYSRRLQNLSLMSELSV